MTKKRRQTALFPCTRAFCSGGKLLSPRRTTIAATAFHFRVRNENGWCHSAKPPEHKARENKQVISNVVEFVAVWPNSCRSTSGHISDFQSSRRDRRISTSRLNTLRCVHLKPINVIISHGSQTIPNLRVGFALICFQRLSGPDIATERSTWRQSSQTSGPFNSVLSY